MSLMVLELEPAAVKQPYAEAAPRGLAAVRRFRWMLAAMALLWLGCEIAALAGVCSSPAELAFINPHFYALALLSTFMFHLWAKPSHREIAATLAAGLVVTLGLRLVAPLRGHETQLGIDGCLGLGVSSLGVLALRAWTSRGEARTAVMLLLLPACLLCGFSLLGPFCLNLSRALNPTTLDARVYAADGALGLQPSFLLGRLFAAVPILGRATLLFYNTISLAFIFLYAMQLRARRPPAIDIIPTVLAAAAAGFTLYLIFPVVGPVYMFATHFPHAPPDVQSVLAASLTVPDEPRNCMPSLHTAWVLLMWWHARPLDRWVRWVASSYLTATLLATLGFGYHYLFDLVVAFPFALAVQAVCTSGLPLLGRRRGGTLLLGSGLTAGWLLVLGGGLMSPAFPAALAVGAAVLTVLAVLLFEHSLYRAAGACTPAPEHEPLVRLSPC
ncbi:MAG TPA: phosphatase PAP2 family protein [Gemmataceae bacterium]|jgi:hypothetical protein|nr:phosphatase PAP2 family protein [Gemmataceae bacterium]